MKSEGSEKCGEDLDVKYFLFMPLGCLLSCSWVLWNMEARQFIYRRGRIQFSRLSRTKQKVAPLYMVHQS